MRLIRFLVLGALGVVFWQNRFKIQQFLESKGVDTPLLGRNLGEKIRSGMARVSGQFKGEARQVEGGIRESA